MDTPIQGVEEKLKSLFCQLQAEQAVFDRIVYKNKNQHRRCSYFQYLLKVRRDLRLLHSANLEELLGSCFQVIDGKKPKQKVHLLESLKWSKSENGKHNFLERLLGAARLLSQMVEPMLKAASDISTLLARSFFMGFSLTVLALLARLRVLVQQILVDVVLVFNTVSSISQSKQSIKIAQDGVEVYREFYPKNEEYVTLECVWEKDKFVLLERAQKSEARNQEGDVSLGDSSVRYQSIESFLEEVGIVDKGGPASFMKDTAEIGVVDKEGLSSENGGESHTGNQALELKSQAAASSSLEGSEPPKPKSSARKVAFVSVKRPAPSETLTERPLKKPAPGTNDNKEDLFYNLLSGGSLRGSLF